MSLYVCYYSVVAVCVVQCDHVSQCLIDSVVCLCVCGPAVCLLYFHVSHWVISAVVITIATMQWHMPASWLPDWQDGCRGEIQRMLEQITPPPLPASEWQSACRSSLPPLFCLFSTSFRKRKTRPFLHKINTQWSPALWTQTDQGEIIKMVQVMEGNNK